MNGPAATTPNVNAGSSLDTQLTALAPASGESHLLATLTDWREINESPMWVDTTQAAGADTNADGIDTDSLLQLVTVADAAGNALGIEHAGGVLFADATPPLATSMTNDGSR